MCIMLLLSQASAGQAALLPGFPPVTQRSGISAIDESFAA